MVLHQRNLLFLGKTDSPWFRRCQWKFISTCREGKRDTKRREEVFELKKKMLCEQRKANGFREQRAGCARREAKGVKRCGKAAEWAAAIRIFAVEFASQNWRTGIALENSSRDLQHRERSAFTVLFLKLVSFKFGFARTLNTDALQLACSLLFSRLFGKNLSIYFRILWKFFGEKSEEKKQILSGNKKVQK